MYKVMLVDDEKLITEGLKQIIDWNKYGYEVVKQCFNGNEALEYFKNNNVDLILCDINMPLMNGLDLIRNIRLINSSCDIVILSGYDDFKYAKEAMKLKVEDYLLKPVDENELIELLIKLKEKKNINLFYNNTYKDELLLFLKNKITYDEATLLTLNPYGDKYNVVELNILTKVDTDIVCMFIKKYLNNLNINSEIIYLNESKYLLVNEYSNTLDETLIIDLLKDLKLIIDEQFSTTTFILIGDFVDDITSINQCYQSVLSLRNYTLLNNKGVIYSKILDKYDYQSIDMDNVVNHVYNLLINNESELLLNYIDLLLNDETISFNMFYEICIKLIELINKVNKELNLNINSNNDCLNTLITLYQASDKVAIINFVYDQYQILLSYLNSKKEYSSVINDVIKYINNNYSENLSLKYLSQKFYLNSIYLGQLFTKEVGMSFSDYIAKVKNEKAKELILNTNMKMIDIAKAVGYNDTSYFYRKFKQVFKVSPSTLRNLK